MRRHLCAAVVLLTSALPAAASSFAEHWDIRIKRPPAPGYASFYSDYRTASGERLRPHDRTDLTCASPSEPLGRCLKVFHVKQGEVRSITCRVNDRGPHARLKRVIDLTPAGFEMLGIPRRQGVAWVSIERVPCEGRSPRAAAARRSAGR